MGALSRKEIDDIFDSVPQATSRADIDAVYDAPAPSKPRRSSYKPISYNRDELYDARNYVPKNREMTQEEKMLLDRNYRDQVWEEERKDRIPKLEDASGTSYAQRPQPEETEERDTLIAQNRSRNAQRRQGQTETTGAAPILGSRKESAETRPLSEAGQKEVDQLNRRIRSLRNTPMTGDAAVDEVTQSNNAEEIANIEKQIARIYDADNADTSSKIDRYIDPDYKMSKYERKNAEKIFDDYLENNPKARDLYKANDAAMSSVLASRLTPEEATEYAKMITLKNKTSKANSALLHSVESVPFVKSAADKSAEKYDEMTGANTSDYDYSAQLDQTMKQNPGASIGGNMAYQLGTYSAFAPLIGDIPVVGQAADKLGSLAKNPAAANFISNVVKGQAADTLLDTLPNVVIPDIANGNWKNLPKDVALNQLINLAFNGASEGVGAYARNRIPGLNEITDSSVKATDDAAQSLKNQGVADIPRADEITSENVNPADLARQNEIDVDAMNAERQGAAEEIQALTEQLPEISLDPEEVGPLKTVMDGDSRNRAAIEPEKTPAIQTQASERPELDDAERALFEELAAGYDGSQDYWHDVVMRAQEFALENNDVQRASRVLGELDRLSRESEELMELGGKPVWSMPDPTRQLDGVADRINGVLNRVPLDDEKIALEADNIRNAIDNYKAALSGDDFDAVDRARKDLNNACKRFNTRANKIGLKGYDGTFGSKNFTYDIPETLGTGSPQRLWADIDRQAKRNNALLSGEPTGDDFLVKLLLGENADESASGELPKVADVQTEEAPAISAQQRINAIPDGTPLPPADTPPTNNGVIPRVGDQAPHGKVSRFATNTMKKGTNLTPEEYEANVDLKDFMYQDKSERQSMADAFNMIREEGVDNLKSRLMSEDAKDLTQSEIDALMSITRTNNATARAMEAMGEDASALRAETNAIYKKLRQQETSNAQALQALAKWTRNTPEGMLMQAENLISGKAKPERSALQKVLDKLKKANHDVDFSPEFEKDFLDLAEQLEAIGDMDSREAKDLMARLGRLVNEQIPVKLGEKVTAYLMDSMLGNFRTLITRNAGGNLGLNAMEQVATRPLAAGIDRLVAMKTGVRKQAGLSKDALTEYVQGFAKGLSDEAHDIKTGLHTARTGENTLENAIRSNRHVFKNKVGDKLDSLVKNGLSIGDRPFYEATYKQTLGDYNRLRKAGVMGADIQNLSDEAFEEYAKTAANLNALAAVYQNNSTLSNALMTLKEGIGDLSEGIMGFDILSQFSMPFVKTPANVVDRAIDYSPLGIVRNAVRTAKEGGIGGENFDQNRFVNETARNIIGSGLMAGAAGAAANGVISGAYSDDPDEKRAQKESGMQEYALNLPGGKQMDISWIPVVGSNAVAAAAAYDAYKNEKDKGFGQALTKGVTAGGQSLFDQAMFQGLQRLFGTGESYNSDEGIVGNMLNVVKQGFGQAIPALLRQTAQVTDDYQRDLSGSNIDASFGPFDNYTLNSWANNIPYLREKLLNPKVDSQGNFIEESQGRGIGSRILEDMILPGKITHLTSNPLADEANRLSDITGNTTSYMPKANRNKVDTEEHTLTNEEYLAYEQLHNSELTKAGEALMNTTLYNEADDQTKESMLSNLYSAVSTAINSNYNGKDVTGAAKAYKEGGMDAAIDYVQYGGILAQYGLQNNEKNRDMVKEGGIEAVENAAQAKELKDEAGVTGSSNIGKMISEAVNNGDEEQAQAMVDSTVALKNLGLEKPGPAATYVKAKEIYGDNYRVEDFADTYKKIDADHNQGIKKDELVSYLTNYKIPKLEGDKLVKVYGSGWKNKPVYKDGTWKSK